MEVERAAPEVVVLDEPGTSSSDPSSPDPSSPDEPRSPRPNDRQARWWERVVPGLLVFLTPVAVLMATGTQLSWLDNTIDPFIYVGTTERLGDYLARWPETYYPYRFGYILPAQLTDWLFGDIGGYVVLRMAFLGLIGLLVWPRRGRWSGRQLAIAAMGAAIYALSPLVQRAAFTGYTPTGTAFFVVSIALIVPTLDRRDMAVWRFVAAGATSGLAWNSHPTVLPVAIVCTTVLLVDQLVEGRGRNLVAAIVRGLAWLLGMGVVIGAAWAYLGTRYDAWDLYGSMFGQASKDTDSVFLEQTATWFTWRHYLLVGPLALVIGLIAHRVTIDAGVRRSLRRLVLVTAASLAVFAVFQWFLDTPLLSIYYYSCIPLALATFLLARSVAAIVSERASGAAFWIAPAVVALLVGILLLGREVKAGYTVIALAAVVVTIAGMAAALDDARRRSAASRVRAVVGALAVLLLAGYVSTSSPHDFPGSNPGFRVDPIYDSSMFTYDQSGLDVYRLAYDYADYVPDLADEPGNFRVWFRRFESGYTNQVQATLVHGMTALQPFPDGGLPDLTPFEVARIRQENLRYVIVVDSDPLVVTAGVRALEGADLGFAVKRSTTFDEGGLAVTVAIMERTPTAG